MTLGAAVIGTGFIGGVHAGALQRNGARLCGVLGSSPERGAEKAAGMGAPKAYADLGELIADEDVRIVHVTSPNDAHYEQTKRLLEGGKNVICEKPLSLTSEESADLVERAAASGLVTAVCYNIRFYPLNQHAHGMVASGGLGDLRLVTGRYHQDWLAKPTDWNWRVTSAGGALRSVGDIGTHWADLTSFVTGERPIEILAELATFMEERQEPVGPVETFSSAQGETRTRKIDTDDAAMILMRYPSGARGAVTISQVSVGRKNSLTWEISGTEGSAAWDSETPDHMWLGDRDGPNGILQRDPAMMNETGAAAAALPGGHVEGFADTFAALFRQVYADVAAGGRQDHSTYASFADGHWEMLFCDAVLKSARSGAWTRIET